MDAQQILASFEDVKTKYAIRDSEFDKIKAYLEGRYDDQMQQGSTLRDEPKYQTLDGSVLVTANLPYLTVQDNTALCTQDPIIEVPAKDDSSAAEKSSTRNQKILYATYEHSGGIQLMHDTSLYERAYGWSVLGATPNLKESRIDWTAYSPRYCYPVFKLGNRVFLREMYIHWKESPEAVKDMYPAYKQEGDSETDSVEMTVYFNKDYKIVIAGNQLVSGIRHRWGFVPFVIIPCQPTIDGLGIGDVHQTIGIAIAHNKLLRNMYKYVDENVNADTAVMTDDDLEPPASFAGRNIWKFSRDSDVKKMVSTSGGMGEAFQLLSDFQELHQALTGTSAGRMGMRSGMYVSQKGQDALSQPLGNRLDAALRIKAERLSLLCEFTLRLYERHFANIKLDLYGRMGRAHFDVSFKGRDIKGHYRTHIRWLPVILSDASNKQIIGLQLLQAKVISKYTYTTRFLPDIIDPNYEDEQIKEETFDAAKLEAASQHILAQTQMADAAEQQKQQMALMPPTNPINTDLPLPSQKENLQLEKGRTNETASGMFAAMAGKPNMPTPTGQPMGPMQVPLQAIQGGMAEQPQMPMGTIPENVGDTLIHLEDVADRIRAVKRIKGKVYLAGMIVMAHNLDPKAGQKLEILITNPLDRQTISNALPDVTKPEVCQFTTIAEGQQGDALEVTPGTQGYEPTGSQDMPDLGGMPPGMPPGMPGMMGGMQ